MARLHGAWTDHLPPEMKTDMAGQDLASLYAAYSRSTAEASLLLQSHGKDSPLFQAADRESMRLFHRVKKMQGLKKGKAG